MYVCVCAGYSFSVFRAHQLRLRLPIGVLPVPDVSGNDRPRQHVSIQPYIHHTLTFVSRFFGDIYMNLFYMCSVFLHVV